MHLIFTILAVAYSLLAWFNKDAFIEYSQLFKLSKLFKIDEFKQVTENDPTMSYPIFLASYYNNFFTRLVSCPICLSFWLSALYSLSLLGLYPWYLYPLVIMAIAYAGLFMYFSLVKIMSNE